MIESRIDDPDDPVYVGWDLKNSGVNKPEEFVAYLKNEISMAFPGIRIDIHAFGVEDDKGTKIMREYCLKEESGITCHFLEKEEGKKGKEKDRADYKLIYDMFIFVMRHRATPLIVLLAVDDDFAPTMARLSNQLKKKL